MDVKTRQKKTGKIILWTRHWEGKQIKDAFMQANMFSTSGCNFDCHIEPTQKSSQSMAQYPHLVHCQEAIHVVKENTQKFETNWCNSRCFRKTLTLILDLLRHEHSHCSQFPTKRKRNYWKMRPIKIKQIEKLISIIPIIIWNTYIYRNSAISH